MNLYRFTITDAHDPTHRQSWDILAPDEQIAITIGRASAYTMVQ